MLLTTSEYSKKIQTVIKILLLSKPKVLQLLQIKDSSRLMYLKDTEVLD